MCCQNYLLCLTVESFEEARGFSESRFHEKDFEKWEGGFHYLSSIWANL
jgi:hypothetical protein